MYGLNGFSTPKENETADIKYVIKYLYISN